MFYVIAHAELQPNHSGHTRTRPQVRGKTCRLGALQEDRFEFLVRLLVQLRDASRLGLSVNPVEIRRTVYSVPTLDASPVRIYHLGNLHRLVPLLQQDNGVVAPPFQFSGTSTWSHDQSRSKHLTGRSLYRSQ